VQQQGSAAAPDLLAGIDLSRLESLNRLEGDGPNAPICSRFIDVAADVGIDFVYENGESPQKLMTQAVGGGVGWIDFDRDGFFDLLLVQGGGPLPADRATNPPDRLFRNLAGTAFVDVTESTGIAEVGFSQGVAVGDFDNDGFDDVYITNVGPDTFYRNLGDGTFVELTHQSGLINPLWGTSAAWADVNHDGHLDLFVCNYTRYDPEHPVECLGSKGEPGICHPDHVDPVPNRLFINRGDGTFTEVLAKAGLDQPGSKSLGVVIADLDSDGLMDIFVANDTTANHLFLNRGNLQFEEVGITAGCAASGYGLYQASMGVAFGDYNRDGHPDLYLTHFTSDSNTLYRGLGEGAFFDATQETGLHVPTLPMLGFGTIMADFDCNGAEELFVANGHIDESFERQGDAFWMRAQRFAWTGSRWVDCSLQSGPYFDREYLGRGVAAADFDNDGDIDLAVSHQLAKAALLRNDREQESHWLKLKFVGTLSNRRGIGVKVTVTQQGISQKRQLAGGTSYCAAHEPALFFGFGAADTDLTIEATWPSGAMSRLEGIRVDQQVVIVEEGPSG
jgi:enediyne biosynthesis protein E4